MYIPKIFRLVSQQAGKSGALKQSIKSVNQVESRKMSNEANEPTDGTQLDENAQNEAVKEPWTTEKVVEWNNYYNLYVALALLILAVVTSLNYLDDSLVWASLRTGETTLQNGFPPTRDAFSLIAENQRWVNLGWGFDTVSALAYKVGRSIASNENAEKWGVAAITVFHSIVRLATFLILLSIGHKRQWIWGKCVLLGLVISATPNLKTTVAGPEVWGLFFLALLLRLMYLVTDRGKTRSLYAILVLLAVWVNFDTSALIGLLLTVGWLAALMVSGKKLNTPISRSTLMPVLVGAFLAVLVNPWAIYSYGAMLNIANQYSLLPANLFGSVSVPGEIRNQYLIWTGLFLVIGGVTFWLNTTQFRLDRLVILIVSGLASLVWLRYGTDYAIVLAVVAGLNLEEWYVEDFGTEGRLGLKWAAFSIGGRAVTLLALIGMAVQHITGFQLADGSSTFGLGFSSDRFPFEAVEYLKSAKIQGNIFNWNNTQGNLILWKAFPERKTYQDGRRNLFTQEMKKEWDKLRVALRDDDAATWKPLLDKYGISTVMVQAMSTSLAEPAAVRTLNTLSLSPNWIPVYDDGMVAIFGRADAKSADLAFFKERKLDADRIVYKSDDVMPAFNRPPSPSSLLDEVIATKALALIQPHTLAAIRWMVPPGSDTNTAQAQLSSPANCFAAIREARRAIAQQPDQTQAYRVLVDAYRLLHSQELAMLSGIKIEPANFQQIASLQAGPNPLGLRFRQRMTALHFAIITAPRPNSANDREILSALHAERAQLLIMANVLDMARDHLRQALEVDPETSLAADRRTQLTQLDEAIAQRESEMNSMTLEEKANAMARINRALSLGLMNPALSDLREAEATGTSPEVIVPILIDLYCQLGMPDQAIPLISNVGNPSTDSSAGLSSYRTGLVSSLLGDYGGAYVGWANESIPMARLDEMNRGLSAGRIWLVGEVGTATRNFLEMPEQSRTLAARYFELALIQLEAGQPKLAIEAFNKSLIREPETEIALIAKYYLEKMGKPFSEPAKPASGAVAPTVPAAASATPAAPAVGNQPQPATKP